MAARSFSVALAAVFLFVVLYASPAQCRRGLLEAPTRRPPSDNATTTTAAAANSTALDDDDGSKFKVIFCVARMCNHRDCYCCETGDYCYYSRKQCQANCESCNPKCDEVPAAVAGPAVIGAEGMPVRHTTVRS